VIANDEVPTHLWFDDQAGPIVRPYAMTGGRTTPVSGQFDLISLILAAGPAAAMHAPGMQPEHLAIIQLCQEPLSVAEIAAHLDLPVGIVRVLLGDLLEHGRILAQAPVSADDVPDDHLFEAVIHGLRAL